MQTAKSIKIQRLRGTALNQAESPEERLKAASKLLIDYGPSEDNVPVVNVVVRLYGQSADAALAERALKLKLKLSKALELRQEAKAVDIPDATIENSSAPSGPSTGVALSISFDSLMFAFDKVGKSLWRQFTLGEVDLDSNKRTWLLEEITEKATFENVQTLAFELQRIDPLSGWSLAHSFPALVRISVEWLAAHGQLQPEPVTTKSFSDRLFEEMNARGCQLKVGESK